MVVSIGLGGGIVPPPPPTLVPVRMGDIGPPVFMRVDGWVVGVEGVLDPKYPPTEGEIEIMDPVPVPVPVVEEKVEV